MDRDSIVFYKDWWEAIQSLPENKRLEAITVVMDYAFTGIEPTDTMLRFATAQIRMFIDRDTKRYETIREKRKAAIKKRWEKSKNERESKLYKCIQENTNEYSSIQPIEMNSNLYLNDNVNGNGNVNDNVNVNGQNDIDKSISSAATSNTISRAGAEAAAKVKDYDGLSKEIAELKGSSIWKEEMAYKFHLKAEDIDSLLDEFRNDVICQGINVSRPRSFFIS